MVIYIDKIIKKECNCCFFNKAKDSCFSFIKEKFYSFFLLKKKSTIEHIELEKSILQQCKPHKNRKKIYIYILSKEIDRHCKKSQKDNDGCLNYVFDKFENEFRNFDAKYDSAVFMQVESKLGELIEQYHKCNYGVDLKELVESVLVDSKKDDIEVGEENYSKQNTASTINRYLKKVVSYYYTEEFDYESRVALLDNALLHIEDEDTRGYFEEQFYNHRVKRIKSRAFVQPLLSIEQELMLRLDGDKERASYIILAILIEFIYKEKFFTFISKRLPLRVIDFYRRDSGGYEVELDESMEEFEYENNDSNTQELLLKYQKNCTVAEMTILALKFGTSLNQNIEEKLSAFTHLEISYLMGVVDEPLTEEIEKKIANLKKALFDSMVEILPEIQEDRVLLTSHMSYRIWIAEPISYKDISEMFGQQPKWASKKREQLINRLKKGQK